MSGLGFLATALTGASAFASTSSDGWSASRTGGTSGDSSLSTKDMEDLFKWLENKDPVNIPEVVSRRLGSISFDGSFDSETPAPQLPKGSSRSLSSLNALGKEERKILRCLKRGDAICLIKASRDPKWGGTTRSEPLFDLSKWSEEKTRILKSYVSSVDKVGECMKDYGGMRSDLYNKYESRLDSYLKKLERQISDIEKIEGTGESRDFGKLRRELESVKKKLRESIGKWSAKDVDGRTPTNYRVGLAKCEIPGLSKFGN